MKVQPLTTQINVSNLVDPLQPQNIRGFNLIDETVATFKVSEGQCWDETSTWAITTDIVLTVNASIVGANGIDIGVLENDTVYAVFAIASQINEETPAFLISKDCVNPIMPGKYDLKRRIGYKFTNGSAEFIAAFQSGDGARRTYIWNAELSVLSSGSDASFTPIDLSKAAPPINNMEIELSLKFVPNTPGNKVIVIPYGDIGLSVNALSGVVASVAQEAKMTVLAGLDSSDVPTINYKVSEVTDTVDIYVVSFVDNL